ncbi:DNA translocase FtsK 4TM domain-containing protein [Microbulbifer thermotolerans]|uniref:DNA translocase FtsK n=1 Tax=Microbulbifer thermotolerans TaxID=252514 RepID=UPI0022498C53|nr:DNA translocase FtsK 4TM domain-containing protein [Microbulbifer thermotolerans]MCX2794982.1 DNA translocase FtsK 4TM domain-containing protein [Microbulbifer thermotolerans]
MPLKAESTTDQSADESGTPPDSLIARLLREGALIALLAGALLLAISLISYDSADPGWSHTGHSGQVNNAIGPTGAWLADVCLSLLGWMAYLFPVLIGWRAFRILRDRNARFHGPLFAIRVSGLGLLLASGAGIATLCFAQGEEPLPFSNGGIIGAAIAGAAESSLGYVGATILLLALFAIGISVFTGLSWLKLADVIGRNVLGFLAWLGNRYRRMRQKREEARAAREAIVVRKAAVEEEKQRSAKRLPPKIEPAAPKPKQSPRAAKEKQGELFSAGPVTGTLPALSLLDPADQNKKAGFSRESLEALSRLLELKLKDFGVVAEVVSVLPGPVVTRFEIQPAPGVKVSKISNLAKDLARSLAVISVRVVEVIPGKSVVGIEIPNENRQMVRLSEVLSADVYENAKSPLTLALGHDISGQPVVADLAKMPHLLVAGTTGSGKSVGINVMLLSLLYKSTPEEVRLILVDPKMLELSVYEGIPHLLTPVITDMNDAANGLRWCVGEMERRYKLMAAMGVRNLAGFNRKVKEAIAAGEPLEDPIWQPDPMSSVPEEEQTRPYLKPLPSIVVVIDEFADMMMIVGKKVEQLIARIAQKARAAGIHLLLATQRPSVDVITGLIKANVPTRIAFQVSSKIDSRTILDQGGAEQLLGHGDMLYLPPGSGVPVRVHGAFVDDHEVHKVVADWSRRGEPEYIDGIVDDSNNSIPVPGLQTEGGDEKDSESDALYDEAVAFVTKSRKASISSVQRHLRIGYNRAARIIDAMEAAGVVSPAGHNGNREVLAPPPP